MAQKFRFRNLFGKTHTKWEDIQPLGGATDGYIIAGNSKFIAYPLQGGMGSTLGVLSYKQAGRVKQVAQVRGHTAHITDFKFLPYQENTVATASQDSTIKLWHIEDDNSTDVEAPLITLNGHGLKVNLIAPHHAAKSILASSSYDKTVKVWNTEEGKDVLTVNQGSQYALSLEWSHDGSLLGSTWNDKQVRIIDPRQQTFVKEFAAHQSTRAQKLAWLGSTSHFVTTGFDQLQKRQLFLWDIRNTSSNIKVEGCSQAQGVLHPFYDNDLGILYLNGKGEGLVRLFEYQNGTLTTHTNDIMVTDTTKGYTFLPKYVVDTHANEVLRMIKLCSKYAEAVSIIYPRKTNDFQEDLYPDCAIDFGQSADSWFGGANILPKVTQMKDLKLGQHAAHHAAKPATTHAQTISHTQTIPHTQTTSHQVHHPTTTTHQPQRKSSNTQTDIVHHPRVEAKADVESKENSNPNAHSNNNNNNNEQQIKLTEENKQLHTEQQTLKTELTNKDNQIAELKHQAEALQTQLHALEEKDHQIKSLSEEVEKLKEQLLQNQQTATQTQEQLQQQNVTLIQENENLTQQISSIKETIQNRNPLIQTLSEQISQETVDQESVFQAAKAIVEFEQTISNLNV